MNEDILLPSLIIAGGSILSIFLYLFMLKFSDRILRMFQLYPESQDVLKFSLRMISSFVSVIVFLVFLRKALVVIGLNFTVDFIEIILLSSGKYFSAFLIIAGGFYLSKMINDKIKGMDTRYKQHFYFISNLVVNTAFILTALTIVGINITVFIEVYKIILLTIGITLSLIIGIPLGIYVSNRMNGTEARAARKRKKAEA